MIVDPAKLAARQITFNELAAALDRENRNYSGGDFYEGKRRYIVRTVGEYQSAEDVNNIVVAMRDSVPVYLRDVGKAVLGHRKASDRVFGTTGQVLILPVIKQAGANVLEIMDELQLAVERLNTERLTPLGLQLTQNYDETVYLRSAISVVQSSLFIGALLAIIVLLLFLRSATSTLVIAVAIPTSLIGTFLMMSWLGRTLNVISLAGLAFAVGMAVDNSIVVLENIYRHRQMGKPRSVAAVDGRGPREHLDDGCRFCANRVHRRGSRSTVRRHRHRHQLHRWAQFDRCHHLDSEFIRKDSPRCAAQRYAERCPEPVEGYPRGERLQ